MKQTPKGWPRISSTLFYDDAMAAIDWLCRVFDFEIKLKIEGEGGRIEHSELIYGEGLIMVGQTGGDRPNRGFAVSPSSIDGKNTQTLCVIVDDADAHCASSKAAGATILASPSTDDYGEEYWADRTYMAEDLEGHRWWFLQRVRG